MTYGDSPAIGLVIDPRHATLGRHHHAAPAHQQHLLITTFVLLLFCFLAMFVGVVRWWEVVFECVAQESLAVVLVAGPRAIHLPEERTHRKHAARQ